ncbi:MAG: pilus assembly protein TadG-related protein [Candidatus Villigracilaceae bacterium]
MKRRLYEGGQALVIIVFGIVGLIGLTALAIDGGRAFAERRHAQNAADTAALAAALKKARGDSANWQNAGFERAAENGYNNDGVNNVVTVISPPTEGPYTGNSEYIQVIIVSHLPTYFAPIIGIDQITNRVQAVARAREQKLEEMFFGNAVVGLAPHECKAVVYQGNANTLITGSGLFVNSDCSCSEGAAFFNNSSAAALSIPTSGLTSVGCVQYKPGSINAAITTGAQPFPYPPPYALPDPSKMCSGTATKSGNTLSGGYYNGTFPPSGVTILQSGGIFCVNGDFKMNANDTLTGHNVVIVMLTGDVTWNGGATLVLDAPDSGDYKGLLLYMPITNHGSLLINGNSASSFTGTFLAPAANITVKGTGDVNGMNSQIIGYTVDLSGNDDTVIHYDANDNWQAPIPASIELSQ